MTPGTEEAKTFGTAAAVVLFSSDMSSANGMDAAAATSPMRELVDSFAARESAPRHLLDGGRRTEVRGTVAKASVAVATHSNPRPTDRATTRSRRCHVRGYKYSTVL